MSDYKRLTNTMDELMHPLDTLIKCRDRLAELEDKIENDTLVELPDMRVLGNKRLIQIIWLDAYGEIQWAYFSPKHKAEAEAKLEEMKRGQK